MVRQHKTLQWNWMEKVPQLQDLIRKECDKHDRKYAWLKKMLQVGTTSNTKEPSKKHGIEGPISKQRRTQRLEEKQIKPKAYREPTKDSPKNLPCKHLWSKKPTKMTKMERDFFFAKK